MTRSENRFKIAFYIVIVFIIALTFRLFQCQYFQADHYLALAQAQHQTVQELPAHRGKIKAKTEYGGEVILATNQTFYSLLAVPRQIKDKQGAADKLTKLTDLKKEEIFKKIDNNKGYLPPLKEKLNYEKAQEIAEENIKGVYLRGEDYRYYPESKLTCHATGYLNGEGEGQYGVEQYYDEILKGDLGLIRARKDVYGRYISVYEKEEPQDGQDLILTIDLSLQNKAQEVIEEAVDKYGAQSGSILIVNPKNGDILSLVNSKKYDPNNFSKEAEKKGVEIFFNPAISAVYEPGSIMKPVVMAAALDSGAVKPQTDHRFGASVKVEEDRVWNSAREAYGKETMVEVLENSDNVGMVWVQQKLGKKKLHRYLGKFGFGSLTGVDLEGEADGNLLDYPQNYKDIDAASNAFGQAISVTPMQMITAFTPFINEGKMVQPHILKKRVNQQGEEIEKETKRTEESIISKKSARQIVDMLVSVVENGQAGQAKIEGYQIAGKTGTAQVPSGDGYSEDKTIHSFIGFAPAHNPAFLMLVRLNYPTAVRWSSLSAAPTFKKLSQFIFNYYQIKPEND